MFYLLPLLLALHVLAPGQLEATRLTRSQKCSTCDNCNTMCPYVCCVYCPDPVWIPSVHACVDLSFVSSRLNIRNATHARIGPYRSLLAWAVAPAD